MGIEEFTDVFRKSTEYDELDRKFKLVCNKGIQEVLFYITKFGLNNTAITEQQALSKIAERLPVGTDQLVKMLETTEALSKQDKFCAPHFKSSLPTQPELVEVPVVKQFIADWYEEHRNDTLEAKFSRAKTDKDIRVQNWYNNCEGRHVNKRANAQEIIAKMTLCGYTVKKEQLYYVAFGFDRFLVKGNAKFSDGTDFIWIEKLEDIEQQEIELQHHFTEAEIKAIDERYWAFHEPVEEEE